METTQSVGDPSPRGARVGVVRESAAGERRVALVPKIIPSLVKQGVEVVVESGAGLGALIPDSAYEEAGATIGDPWSADVVVKVAPPSDDEVAKLSEGQTLIGFGAAERGESDRRVAGRWSAGLRGGGDPADFACAGHGRVVVAGERRRL